MGRTDDAGSWIAPDEFGTSMLVEKLLGTSTPGTAQASVGATTASVPEPVVTGPPPLITSGGVPFGLQEETRPPPVVYNSFTMRDLRKALRGLGTPEHLKNKKVIPHFARCFRDGFLPELGSGPDGALHAFKPFLEIFELAKSSAHRKALLYAVHELFNLVRNRCRSKSDGAEWKKKRTIWSKCCVEGFLIGIGKKVSSMSLEERKSYIGIVGKWS